MRGLPSISSAEAFRVRRWDVLMLGSALPGLVAAARLGQRGLRVLILEGPTCEANELAREPYLLVDAETDGLLNECLRALGVPLIEQRRFVGEEVALQICDAERRVDLGRGTHTAQEWASWGLASLESARTYVGALDEAAEAERRAMLETGLSQTAGSRAKDVLSGSRRAASRGWPASLGDAPETLRALLDAPVRALSNLGERTPSPEARARLLGGLLRGGVSISGGSGQLRGLLRRRVETLYGEFRALDGEFRLVSVAGQPGLTVSGSKEIWTGRALILNAPTGAIAAASEDPIPDLLHAAPIRWRRLTRHFRGPREQLPPSMADRVVWRDPVDGTCVALRVFRGRRSAEGFDLVASAVVPVAAPDEERAASERFERALADLMPFSEGVLEQRPVAEPGWDSDAWLADPTTSTWPEPPEIRVSSKPAVFALERASVGGLGGEGELWLGWRAGDAIGEELA